jgi:hypothetical protein
LFGGHFALVIDPAITVGQQSRLDLEVLVIRKITLIGNLESLVTEAPTMKKRENFGV